MQPSPGAQRAPAPRRKKPRQPMTAQPPASLRRPEQQEAGNMSSKSVKRQRQQLTASPPLPVALIAPGSPHPAKRIKCSHTQHPAPSTPADASAHIREDLPLMPGRPADSSAAIEPRRAKQLNAQHGPPSPSMCPSPAAVTHQTAPTPASRPGKVRHKHRALPAAVAAAAAAAPVELRRDAAPCLYATTKSQRKHKLDMPSCSAGAADGGHSAQRTHPSNIQAPLPKHKSQRQPPESKQAPAQQPFVPKLASPPQPSALKQPARLQLSVPKPTSLLQPSAPKQRQGGTAWWPFPVDYNDHFETSSRALRDMEPVLTGLAKQLGKTKQQLVVYDPFYCQGAVRQHLAELGFPNVRHECRDFYADVAAGTVPKYDILVTNPPYSADHKERCLEFCVSSGKPWALLLPNYVATKQYYADIVAGLAGQGGDPFYMVPDERYAYEHPEGTGHAASPFYSIWFVHLGRHTAKVAERLPAHPSLALSAPHTTHRHPKQQHERGGAVSTAAAAAASSGVARLVRSVAALQAGQLVPTAKRPNPKQRKKMQQKKAASG